jgi:hypothetical protein
MNLYSQLGSCIHLELPAWEEILLAARCRGWQPTGTVRPPLALDVDLPRQAAPWPADTYDLPRGQTVLRQDALSLRVLRVVQPGTPARIASVAALPVCWLLLWHLGAPAAVSAIPQARPPGARACPAHQRETTSPATPQTAFQTEVTQAA